MKPDFSHQDPYRHALSARKAIGAALIALVLLAIVLHQAMAQDVRFFRVGTGTTGGTYFPIGGIIASAISGPPGAPPCHLGGSCGVPGMIAVAQASRGSVDNIEGIRSGLLEAGFSQADVAYYAFTGTERYQSEGPMETLRGIANLYVETMHIVVRADSDIRTVADLAGHNVTLGEDGSGTLVTARLILAAYGLDEEDMTQIRMEPEPAADALVDGVIDALFVVGGAPFLAIEDAAARTRLRLLPVSGQERDTLLEAQPFLVATEIPADAYTGVGAVSTIGVGAQLVVSSEVDDATVYGITKALWHPTTLALLRNGHPRGAEIQIEKALDGLAVPLHPGAARYYGEMGLFSKPGIGATREDGAGGGVRN